MGKTGLNSQVFTTGRAAEICKISVQTIIKCIEGGKLKAYLSPPGFTHRRITREELVAFMEREGLPMDGLS